MTGAPELRQCEGVRGLATGSVQQRAWRSIARSIVNVHIIFSYVYGPHLLIPKMYKYADCGRIAPDYTHPNTHDP